MNAQPPSLLYTGEVKNTPLGDLRVALSDRGLVAVTWDMTPARFAEHLERRFKCPVQPDEEKTAEVARQLREYLNGERREFTIPIDWSFLRPFQRKVLQATFAIPYGATRTYGDLAFEVTGNRRAARAVGRAEATNPMPLVIPCHRVIGANGKLIGYGGGEGLKTKEWLLKLEGAVLT
ncbi:MAG: methylated-DNA--[protein]-cysteine S-methyltransferase [Anaerolineae bacterium]|nr:MAG: methylated-DNA--[protein]-cysteine S-methyltransferase [Anaerolineae bacterium]